MRLAGNFAANIWNKIFMIEFSVFILIFSVVSSHNNNGDADEMGIKTVDREFNHFLFMDLLFVFLSKIGLFEDGKSPRFGRFE